MDKMGKEGNLGRIDVLCEFVKECKFMKKKNMIKNSSAVGGKWFIFADYYKQNLHVVSE